MKISRYVKENDVIKSIIYLSLQAIAICKKAWNGGTRNDSLNLFNNSLYLFCGECRDRIKGILWEGNGFFLLYKLLFGPWDRSDRLCSALAETLLWKMQDTPSIFLNCIAKCVDEVLQPVDEYYIWSYWGKLFLGNRFPNLLRHCCLCRYRWEWNCYNHSLRPWRYGRQQTLTKLVSLCNRLEGTLHEWRRTSSQADTHLKK